MCQAGAAYPAAGACLSPSRPARRPPTRHERRPRPRPAAGGGGLAVRVAAAAGAGRSRPFPRSFRARLADHLPAGPAGRARGRAGDAAGARGAAGVRRRPGDGRRAGQDPARVPPGGGAALRSRRAGRCATASSSTTARRTPTTWFLVVLDALEDAALAAELEPAWRAAAGWLAARARARRRPRALRAADPPRRPGAAGLARRRRAGRGPSEGRRDRAARRLRARRRRWPTPTPRRWPTLPCCALARLDPGAGWEARAAALRAVVSAALRAGRARPRGRWHGPCRAPARSSAGCCGRARSRTTAAAAAAERLCRPDVLCAHGLRTLSSEHPAFRPDAYHRGAVWPFDSWLGWGGLRAAGRAAEAELVRAGVLGALDRLGLAPELYAVGRDGALAPVPVANRVQAWTVGARWALEPAGTAGLRRRTDRPACATGDLQHDLDIALDAHVGERDRPAAAGALEHEVDPRAGDPQAAYLHAAEPARERRSADAQAAPAARRDEPEAARDQVGDGARRPRLGLAGDGIGHRRLELRAREAGEQLRQPVAAGGRGRLEQRLEDAVKSSSKPYLRSPKAMIAVSCGHTVPR